MQCENCQYLLWNLNQPNCPECGTEFDIRSYRFVPNTVAFGCPYCGSQHSGAGPDYLPSTEDQAMCYGCGRAMPVAGMSVIPLVENAIAIFGGGVPLDRPEQGNFIARWYRTCVMSMVRPSKLGRGINGRSNLGRAYALAAANHIFTASMALAIMAISFMIFIALPPQFRNDPAFAEINWHQQLFAGAWMVPFSLILPAVLIVLIALPAHIMLMLCGGKSTEIRQSIGAVLYGQGPYILGLIPLCGCQGFVAAIWTLVAMVMIFRATHRISGGMAALCVIPGALLSVIAVTMMRGVLLLASPF